MKRLITFIIFVILYYSSAGISSAAVGDLLFEDNFDIVNLEKWTVARNTCSSNWTYSNGQYGIDIWNNACVTESIPSNNYWDNDWNDYAIELDMIFVSGTDKNIAWRYIDENQWVDIHFIGSVPVFQRLTLTDSENIQPLTNGNTYHFRIEAKGNLHKVWYYNINSPQNISYLQGENQLNKFLTGRPALQASAGNDMSSSVRFDNVIVTDLSEDEAEGLAVPHFSQLDTEWKDKEYDTASLINPVGSQEIEDWGCALTSAAMILKYHGYDTTPDGELLTPETLNEYLKLNNGYNQVGGVVWSSITSFAIDAATHSAYLNQNLPKLEFQYPEYDLDHLTSDIELSNPAILKIITDDQGTPYESDDATHFVVAKGIQNDQILINDPLDLQETDVTLSERYSDKVIKQMGRFIPSNTDLSYIWLYNYDPQVNLVVEYQGKKTGIGSDGTVYNQIPGARYFEDSIIGLPPTFDLKFGGADTYVQVFMLPKPESGNYKITYSSNSNLLLNNDLHIFDAQSRNEHFKVVSPLTTSSSVSYLLTFDKSNSDLSTLVKVSDYQSLRAAIHYSESQNWLSSNLADRLLNLVTRAEKGRVSRVSRVYLSRIDYLLDLNKNSELTIEAYQLIKPELDAVLASL